MNRKYAGPFLNIGVKAFRFFSEGETIVIQRSSVHKKYGVGTTNLGIRKKEKKETHRNPWCWDSRKTICRKQ